MHTVRGRGEKNGTWAVVQEKEIYKLWWAWLEVYI
jgi:hypothetical protein